MSGSPHAAESFRRMRPPPPAMLTWIRYKTLLSLGLIPAILPLVPMPHLIEKPLMLKNKKLTRPIDIVDLIRHLSPFLIMALKYFKESN